MILLPIDIDDNNNKIFLANQDCIPILNVYPDYYAKVGYNKPWIGYFASLDGIEMVGAGGFKGKPKDGKVEIAYTTFEKFEGKGIATEICRQLIMIAKNENPDIRITARTLHEGLASISILKKNGFHCTGTVIDEDDGEVLEWELLNNIVN